VNLIIVSATLGWKDWRDCIQSVKDTMVKPWPVVMIPCLPLILAYEDGYRLTNSDNDIIGYVHDDVMIYEPGWDIKVMHQFEDQSVGVVGFGGGLGHGDPQLYMIPYHLSQLARQLYRSNTRDAEVHGERFTGECDVAVLDGFALFIRRKLLDAVGGWPLFTPVGYYCYDYWICCAARELGYRIRLVGVDCHHLGGRSSYPGLEVKYEEAHKYIYDRFPSVLPFYVKP